MAISEKRDCGDAYERTTLRTNEERSEVRALKDWQSKRPETLDCGGHRRFGGGVRFDSRLVPNHKGRPHHACVECSSFRENARDILKAAMPAAVQSFAHIMLAAANMIHGTSQPTRV